MTRIGMGMIGAGTAASHAHLPAIAAEEQFDLLALCDRDRSRLEKAHRLYPAPMLSASPEEILDSPGIQAVIIATPPDSHAEIIRLAVTRGKHVLVEKPLACNTMECRDILMAAASAGVCLRVGHEKRFHPSLRRVHDLIQNGAIGDVYYGGIHWASNAKLDPNILIPEGYRTGYEWRWANPAIGGGIVMDHLPHYVDLIYDWLQTRPIAVYAQIFNVARERLDWPRPASVWEDLGVVLVRFNRGFTLRFETGVVGRSLSPLWSLGSGIGEWTEYGYLLGTRGQILFDLLPWDSSENGRIAVWQLQRAAAERLGWSFVEQPEPPRAAGSPAGAAHVMFSGQLREFARAIKGENDRAATAEDGAFCIAAVEAAYRSAEERRECGVLWPCSGSPASLEAPGG